MKPEVLANFYGQLVDIWVPGKYFTGTLYQSELDDSVVEIMPATDYYKNRYGSAVIKVDSITAIRLIKPHVEEDECDDDGA
jgi:hypothetical protein